MTEPTIEELEAALARIREVRQRCLADTDALLKRVDVVCRRRLEGIRCAVYGGLFQPARRSDALICSNACRQKLYRRRVADKVAKRNADSP